MVRLREIPRTAAFTWSPGASSPFLATGTRAGAVDADFSSDTQLELWDLDLSNPQKVTELQPAASITTDSRFHDIAWALPKDDHRGIIAGALENGSLDLWDAGKLLGYENEPLISRTSKHSGAIKTLQFNPFRHELLATAGAKGELFISDLNNIANPFRLGNTAARADDFECLDWNKKVPHILVTGSSGGFVTVWDVKSKKESLTLNNLGRKAVSAVAWDPEKPTRLITAVPLDTDPLILVWDLRNSNAPEKVLRGHEGGVLSLSWCRQDPDLLLSCGKDNRTICWNPQTGEPYGEFSVVTNWTFQTRWNPHNPSFLATASFDGKIAVQTIQNTKPEATPGSAVQPLDGEDFFEKARSQVQISSFSLQKAPKWLERPCGVSFGFGGKVISFADKSTDGGSGRSSIIRISDFAVDSEIGNMTEAFAKAMSENDLAGVCDSRIEQATTDSDTTDWKVIKTLIGGNPRKELVNYLGFSESAQEAAGDTSNGIKSEEGNSLLLDGSAGKAANSNRLSSFFETGGDGEGDNFLAELASTKGAKTNNPFHIYSDSEPEADKKITQALMLGQFETAMELCLKEDRLSDAFMIAICGGQSSIDKVQKAYFKKQASGPKYLRLLASVVGKNLWDVVYNADLENWKEVMATLCTYANKDEFPDLCEALGDRLEEQASHSTSAALKKQASFCYIAGSKLEKVVGLWISELEHTEKRTLEASNNDSSFSIHARSIQSLIEKVSVFREVTRYQDKERSTTSNWKLAPLYEKYLEYADIVAAHGQLPIAQKYLDLLPDKYPAAEVARNRVKQASKKQGSTQTARQPVNANVSSHRPVANIPAFEDQRAPSNYAPQSIPQPQGLYAPQNIAQSQGAYAPSAPNIYNPYQSGQQTQALPGRPLVPPPPSFGAPPQGPPRTMNQSPAVPPPSKAQNMPNWNDTPEEFFTKPTSRRGTPSVQPATISAPFPNQSQTMPTPPMAGQQFQSKPPPTGPPPRTGAPPRSMTPQMGGLNQVERPSSSAASMYAPPPAAHIQQAPMIPRGPSPYNPPPPGASTVTPSRYAPAPAVTQTAPPSQRPPPPPNPYASRQSFSSAQDAPYNQSGPPQANIGPPQGSSQGPPLGGPPPGGPTAQPSTPPTTQRRPTNPPTPKFPPGDRSHIPSKAQPVFDLLNEDMQRVKTKAPSSYKVQVNDTEKRLNILFDHLNNETLLKPNTIEDMVNLAQAVRNKNYEGALAIHVDIMTHRTDECTNWMIGVKRLIAMSRATP